MRIAVYCITRDRLDYTRKSLKLLRKMAGLDIDLFVADNGSRYSMTTYLKKERSAGNIKYLKLYRENVGQNIATNHLIDEILKGDYKWILRWDNDAIPRSRRFLKKLVRRTERLLASGIICVTSPRISKLKHEPPALFLGDELGFPYESVQILGGICRLHPAFMFHNWRTLTKPFRFSKYAPLGFGEASEMAGFCGECSIQMLRFTDLEVEHFGGSDSQELEDPKEFSWARREVGRYVSYGLQ